MKKILKMLLLVFFLIVLYSYVLVIERIPDKLTLFEGEQINLKTILGIQIRDYNGESIETSSNTGKNKIYK